MSEDANQVARRVSTSSASEERRFLETRVAQARLDFDHAAQKLRDFQEQYRIISLPEQAKAIITSVATLRAELIDKQMQLAFVQGYSSNDEATTSQLRRQVSVIQSKLKSLEEPRSGASGEAAGVSKPGASESRTSASSLFPPAMEIPSLQYQLEYLSRDQKIQDALFGLLTQRYELARISEARDTPTFEMLDKPVLPTRNSRPHKLGYSSIGVFLGLVVGVVASLIRKFREAPGDV